jgi:hypothetical protein
MRRTGRGKGQLTRRDVLTTAVGLSVAATSWAKSDPQNPDRQSGKTLGTTSRGGLPIIMLVDGGLLWLDESGKKNKVEVAYPKTIDSSCKVPPHAIELHSFSSVIPELTGAVPAPPWNLKACEVTFESGSMIEPKSSDWRDSPQKPHPDPKNKNEFFDLDWIPTIAGGPSNWKQAAGTRLVIPTGTWSAYLPVYTGTYGRAYWKLQKANGQVVRSQYISDRARWLDTAANSLVIRFLWENGDKGTATFKASTADDFVFLVVTSGAVVGHDIAVYERAEHYCMYDSLLADPSQRFIPERDVDFTAMPKGEAERSRLPGKFCAGAKVMSK